MPSSPKKDLQAFKRVYRKTNSIQKAALAAGYSQAVAKKGHRDMPAQIQRYILRHKRRTDKLIELAKSYSAEDQENLMRGAIIANVSEGKDRATGSIKLGGQDKRVNMWQSDQQVGIFTIMLPQSAANMIKAPVVNTLTDGNQP